MTRQFKPGQLQTGSLYNISSSYAVTASYAAQALSASYAPFVPTDTSSLLTTASVSNATITFTKGNSTTFPLTVNNVNTAQTASYVLQAISSSFSTTASYAVSSSFTTTSSVSLRPINTTGSTLYSTSPSTGNVSANNGIFLGGNAGGGATNANLSVFLGYYAGQLATNANESIIMGPAAGLEASKANNSVFLGSGAGYRAVSASYSVALGTYAGSAGDTSVASVGTNNILIGNYITLPSQSRDSINMGAIIFATGSYSNMGTMYSGSQYNVGRVGINKVTPQYTLDVSGSGNYSNGLSITGSLSVLTGSTTPLNTATYTLSDSSNIASVGWNKRNLSDASAKVSVDWLNRKLYGSTGALSANWAVGLLYDSTESSSIDYGSRYAIDTSGTRAIEWNSRRLSDTAGNRSILWGDRIAYDGSVIASIAWSKRDLYDNTGVVAANWKDRKLIDSSTTSSVNWEQRSLRDTTETVSIDWGGRRSYDSTGAPSIDWEGRVLTDSVGNGSVDWESKQLADGIGTATLNWDAYNNNYKIAQYGYGETQITSGNQEEFSTIAINNGSQNAAGETIHVSTNIDPTVVIGDLTSLGEDGIWYQTDQSSISGSCMLGICVNGYNKGFIFTEGTITVVTSSGYTDIPFVEGTSFYGKPVYMRPGVLGGLTTTVPTTGYVRVVGHIYYNNTTNTDYWLMKFRPSNDWYEI